MEAKGVSEEHKNDLEKLGALMKGIKFAMLTTVEEDGSLRSRPMTTQDVEFDGDLWFFTGFHSPKVWEARKNQKVNVAYSDPGNSKYISVSGTATVTQDRSKMQELWKPAYKVFFPKGLDDPELALLKVNVEQAEYWDSASTALGRAFNFARAYISKDPSKLGDHAKVSLK